MKCEKCERESFVEIIYGKGKMNLCLNCVCQLAYELKDSGKDLEPNENIVCDITNRKGAILYVDTMCNTVEMYCLNSKTFTRLICRDLNKIEYKALTNKYGYNNYLIHEDFYDPITCCALQPIE